ncbi:MULTISPECIES: hypothetical protein [unclassified Empedobacter]|uniref:hypothetical protein n=1 Tax=Empedobacter TaxID=59734 RepID=UPI002575A43E|nr:MULTISPECIES: hypothetical protein [unclassified Empedobacter]MDM1139993.1 hypothetical protein [Empedobacter sp. R132-2]
MEDYCDQIFFLTDEKYEYEQANIHFINPKLPEYSEQCNKKIDHLQHIRTLTEELQVVKEEKCNYNKLQFNGKVNQLVDIFYQLNRELFINGKNYLDGNVNEISKMIVYSFVDKDGNKVSIETVKTILTPSREEKRPNNAKRIDVDKLL